MPALDPDLAAVVDTLNESGLMIWAGLDAEAVRGKFAQVKQTVREPAIARVEDINVPAGGVMVPCRLYHPAPGEHLPLLVWCHGGGWVLGTLDGEEATARFIASTGPLAVLSVGYRLAPEHRFPTAYEDALATFDWARANAAALGASSISIGGASAGGNLAAAVSLHRTGIDAPRAQLLVYPILDCDLDRPSVHAFAEGLVLHRDHLVWFWDQYVPDPGDRVDPRVAPLRARVPVDLAPLAMVLAAQDPLVDEGRDWAAKVRAAGVDVRCVVADGMTHGCLGMSRKVPAAGALFQREIRTFVARLADG